MRRRLQVPNHPPVEHRTLLDAVCEVLPYQSKRGGLTIDKSVISEPASRDQSGVVRVRRQLTFEVNVGDCYFEFSLPVGRSKYGELWEPHCEPWLTGDYSGGELDD